MTSNGRVSHPIDPDHPRNTGVPDAVRCGRVHACGFQKILWMVGNVYVCSRGGAGLINL